MEPNGASFVGGGLWHPDSAALAKLRASIDERPARWRRVLNAPGFRGRFLGIVPPSTSSSSGNGGKKGGRGKGKGKGGKGRKAGGVGAGEGNEEEGNKEGQEEEEAAIKAFAERNQEGALKTRPKGFIPEHRDMQLLKLRNFTVGTKVADGVFTSARAQEEVASVVRDMVGFVSAFPPCRYHA